MSFRIKGGLEQAKKFMQSLKVSCSGLGEHAVTYAAIYYVRQSSCVYISAYY